MADGYAIERFIEVELAIKRSVNVPEPRDLPALLADWGFGLLTQEASWIIAYDADKKIRSIAEVSRGNYHSSRVSLPPLLSAVMLAATPRIVSGLAIHRLLSDSFTITRRVTCGRQRRISNSPGLSWQARTPSVSSSRTT